MILFLVCMLILLLVTSGLAVGYTMCAADKIIDSLKGQLKAEQEAHANTASEWAEEVESLQKRIRQLAAELATKDGDIREWQVKYDDMMRGLKLSVANVTEKRKEDQAIIVRKNEELDEYRRKLEAIQQAVLS